jgi:hypothetical protein
MYKNHTGISRNQILISPIVRRGMALQLQWTTVE